MIPREEINLFTECSIVINHQVNRESLISGAGDGDEEGEDDGGESVGGGGDWSDHSRHRKGKLTGIWVRIGIKGSDGKMIWRELTDPANLPKKVLWDQSPAATATE
jgi:hypothetical protein